MKILHTSDWHLGRTLYGRRRYDEFTAFLDWLYSFINEEKVDILLIAGDIFDNTTPSNKAQELYYKFLCRISANSYCKHIVITAGNHDSPSFLSASKDLLKTLKVHVTGTKEPRIEDEVLVLTDGKNDEECAVICTVPYLRDRDIRTSEAGESVDDKYRKLIGGIENHYKKVASIAQEKRQECTNRNIPIIGMGHLFAAGGKTCDGDGVRELYVGSLAYVNVHNFATDFDYMALGHLHVPQSVGGYDHVRYSGSPIAMGFGESKQQKSVVVVEFDGRKQSQSKLYNIPCFQQLDRLTGDLPEILDKIDILKNKKESIWLEIEYTGTGFQSDLREQIENHVEGSKLEVRRIKNNQVYQRILKNGEPQETLEDLDVFQVFENCLEDHNVEKVEHEELKACYRELVQEIEEQDRNKE